ncbi:methyltransferase domain-containing protein [Sulfurovum sp. zt1-1]|uniref:Methyltransferase domain-containing protein n=1 Tax=Sulfurovum zhangzhouensis TaxID=3019067 RepID=A0ABT7QXI0_9BACT|nr:methyltransferase domain-containing protein [Sulfurovum zhangzhouensis]MDM5271544.1 methyltransferase domain-containing protein [Sulfurovum zhangzhouensis]
MKFTNQTMQEIIAELSQEITSLQPGDVISFDVLDPDEGGKYAGEEVIIEENVFLYHGYKSWTDLAQLLQCKMLTPHGSTYPFITLHFEKLQTFTFHNILPEDKKEKYGIDSIFFNINKMEEPAFLYYYLQALDNVKLVQKKRVLNLGINRGDEFIALKSHLDNITYQKIKLVGIDHSQSAITYAKMLLPEKNVELYAEDINALDSLNLGRFDLIVSIGTLQSPSINFKPFLMNLVQNYIDKEQGALILGFPNCRWIGGEMLYGAKAPNYAMSELSLLFNDVIFAKKYLQQHKFRVTLTGKEYIFLTATKITSKTE